VAGELPDTGEPLQEIAMPRTPNDDRSDPLDPDRPQGQSDVDKQADPLNPDKVRSGDGEARDQGDQTEDNKKQQE
jgi:hypothetical protein